MKVFLNSVLLKKGGRVVQAEDGMRRVFLAAQIGESSRYVVVKCNPKTHQELMEQGIDVRTALSFFTPPLWWYAEEREQDGVVYYELDEGRDTPIPLSHLPPAGRFIPLPSERRRFHEL